MTDTIQTSLHGSRLGINDKNQIVAQGADGLSYAITPVPSADNEIVSIGNAGTALANKLGAVSGVSGVALTSARKQGSFFELNFTLTSVAVAITDAGASGAGGGVKLFDFVQGAIQSLGSRTNLSAIVSDTTLDVGGDLAIVHALGSAAANAGDLALTGTEVDFGAVSGTVTLSANAGSSASVVKGPGAAAIDGTSTAADLYLNFSASAATADATGVLTVTGTVTVIGTFMGDD